LLSYIKTRIDRDRRPGQWLLTGSQNFVLMENVAQSLAGRAAVLTLLPFSIAERCGNARASRDVAAWFKEPLARKPLRKRMAVEELILRGFYPEIATLRAVCDFLKRFLNFGLRPSMYYVRSRDGLEVDLVVDLANRLHLFEIKGAATITDRHAV
jgi:hypothetical protein